MRMMGSVRPVAGSARFSTEGAARTPEARTARAKAESFNMVVESREWMQKLVRVSWFIKAR